MQQEWIEVLRSLFRRTDEAPPPIAGGFVSLGLDIPDDMPRVEVLDDHTIALVYDAPVAPDLAVHRPPQWVPPGVVRNERMRPAGDDLWGITFAIEYADSRGNETTRRITLRELYRADDGAVYLHSFCHERQALRSFRFDRIHNVIDLDGVVHSPRAFFESELRFPVDDRVAPEAMRPARPAVAREPLPRTAADASPTIAKAGLAHRRAARDGLRVLAALAHADGLLHEAEVAVILDYVIERAAADGIETADDDRTALLPYLRRQYPPAAVLDECLHRLAEEPAEHRRLFLHHTVALIDSDGIQHPAEFDMLLDLRNRL